MANTILRVETANTFDQWRIVTNTLVNAANELRNNTYIKDSGGLTVSNGSIVVSKGNIQIVNGTLQIDRTGETLYVVSDARVGGNLIVGNALTVAGVNVFTSLATTTVAYTRANSASNTVRVSANSGSVQSNVGLNFVNTSSILVSVSAGTAGNANVAFAFASGAAPTFSTLSVTGDATITGNVLSQGVVTLDATVRTSNFNAVANKRYLANTVAGVVTMTLPASPAIGDRICVVDYGRNFGTLNLTVGRNTKLIMGLSEDLTCDITGSSVDLVYTDTTKGWILI